MFTVVDTMFMCKEFVIGIVHVLDLQEICNKKKGNANLCEL